jgi:sucrose-6-phosphate hydrolase SacC (GH32 family)
VVDKENVLGHQQGSNPTLLFFYSENRCGLRLMYSTDQGKSWKKSDRNPVLAGNPGNEALNPRIFWHNNSRKWVMAIYTIPDNETRKKGFSFYHSKNLLDWEFGSHLAGFSEYPSVMELKVNNRADETRWVVMEDNGNYIIGTFNGFTFMPESIRMKSDFGPNFSCPENIVNLPADDGRTIQMAALKQGEWPDMPFSGQMTFPVELSLRKISTGTFLTRQPVREIEKLYGKQTEWKNENLIPGINKNLIKKIQGECFRIKGRFDLKNCDSFGIMLRSGKKNPGVELLYNVKRQTLSLMGHSIGLAPIDNKIALDILVDRASSEVFANGGIASISALIFPEQNDNQFTLFNNGGELLVEELTITEINSPWWEVEIDKGKKKK